MTYKGYLVRTPEKFELDGTRQDTDKIIPIAVRRGDVFIFGGPCSYNIPNRKIAPVAQKEVGKEVANVPETVDDKVGFSTPTNQFQ